MLYFGILLTIKRCTKTFLSAKVNRKNYGKFYDKNTQDLRQSPCEVTILATLIVLGCGVEVAWSVVVHTPQLVSQTSPLPSRRQCHLLCVLLLY